MRRHPPFYGSDCHHWRHWAVSVTTGLLQITADLLCKKTQKNSHKETTISISAKTDLPCSAVSLRQVSYLFSIFMREPALAEKIWRRKPLSHVHEWRHLQSDTLAFHTLLYLRNKYTSSDACAVAMFIFMWLSSSVIGRDVIHYCRVSTSVKWSSVGFRLEGKETSFSHDS